MLYGVVQDHLATLLDTARDRSEHGFGYPRFVEREFEKFLACGLLCHGFVRVQFRWRDRKVGRLPSGLVVVGSRS